MDREQIDSGDPRVNQFLNALRTLEQAADPEPLCALYGPDSVAGSVQAGPHGPGPDGARAFWSAYRSHLGPARSRFRSIVVSGDQAAIEWETEVPGRNGGVDYHGVTMLDYDGDQVVRSWAYFNPLDLGRRFESANTSR